MAIWQFDFIVVPKENIIIKFKSYPEKINLDDIDDIGNWNHHNLIESTLKELAIVLKPTKSWSDEIKQFGRIDESCVKLLYDKNILEEISVRLDLRNLTYEILKPIINFIKENNALIITDDGNLINAEINELINQIKKSDSYSFVKNPKDFLMTLES